MHIAKTDFNLPFGSHHFGHKFSSLLTQMEGVGAYYTFDNDWLPNLIFKHTTCSICKKDRKHT